MLRAEIPLVSEWTIADVGSGTGLSAELFLENGNRVYGVEPNEPMRRAAETSLRHWARFVSVDGTAEATTLQAASVDLVIAAQAFHWFDRRRASLEFARIARPPGRVALLWNTRRTGSTPFLRAYEALLLRFGTDYARVRHEAIGPDVVRGFLGGAYSCTRLYNEQVLDLAGLKGRLASSSYVPPPTDPAYEPMVRQLEAIFNAHQENGLVRLEYDTEVHHGTM